MWTWETGPSLAEAASGHSEQAPGLDEARCKSLPDPQVAVFEVSYWSVKTAVLSAFGEMWVFWLQLPTCVPGLTLCGCSILPVSLPVVTITLLKVAFQVKHREAWPSLNESFHFLWGLLLS